MEEMHLRPQSEGRRSTRKRNIIIITVLSLCVAAIIGTAVGIHFRGSEKSHSEKYIKSEDIALSLVCTDIPDDKKFDCFPDVLVNEKACIDRGCCYSAPKNDSFSAPLPPLNVPYCYYPSNYKGYMVADVFKTSRRIRIKLHRSQRSGFDKDISSVNVLITYIDDSSLRIKITDADNQRYEVPTQLHYQTKQLVNPLYSVKVDSESGVLTVLRNSTESVIFKTNLAQLVFSDQFIQLSSDLPSPYIYGIGEHYESILRNVNWTRFTLLNSDLSPIPNHALYGSHPFYMALEKDGKANGVFLHNSNIMDVILQPAPAITFRPIGGILDFYIMAGPSPNDVTRQYSNIVGKTFMPPFWSLGFHLCRYGYNSLNATRQATENTVSNGIPLDVQWNDIDYMDKYKDFSYDKEKFDGLPEFVEDLHKRGMHYVLMIDPAISNSENIPYEEGLDDDIFVKHANGSILVGQVWPGNTVYPDFSHPASISYWTRQFRRLQDTIKYDGVWIDMNEPSNFVNGALDGCPNSSFENPQYVPGGNLLITKTLCMTAKHYSSIHYNEHNLYGYREAIATYEAIKTVRKRRPFIISRATYAGQGVFSGHWSGDVFSTWEDMRYSIRSMINFNMYAVPMIGTDICGFNGNATEELCARWQALGAFYPFSRNHNEIDTIPQDPGSMGPTVIAATKDALLKRYASLPYLYTLFYRSHAFGDTVVRPLFYEFPEDKNTYSIDEQFLWGPGLMIVPALYPNTTSVEAYFPKGLWYDAITGMKTKSPGVKVTLEIPTTFIYLAVRGGFIYPTQTPAATTTDSRKTPFQLNVALDDNQSAFGELYWDDGDSLNTYENGFYNLIQFRANNDNLVSEIVNKGYQSDMALSSVNILGFTDMPTNVTLNGHNCIINSPVSPKNSSAKTENFKESSDPAKDDDFCHARHMGNILVIASDKTVSLLLPLTVTWK